MFTPLSSQGKAYKPTGVSRHKVYVFSTHLFSSNDEISFVLSIFIVHEYDHLAQANVINDFLCRI